MIVALTLGLLALGMLALALWGDAQDEPGRVVIAVLLAAMAVGALIEGLT